MISLLLHKIQLIAPVQTAKLSQAAGSVCSFTSHIKGLLMADKLTCRQRLLIDAPVLRRHMVALVAKGADPDLSLEVHAGVWVQDAAAGLAGHWFILNDLQHAWGASQLEMAQCVICSRVRKDAVLSQPWASSGDAKLPTI